MLEYFFFQTLDENGKMTNMKFCSTSCWVLISMKLKLSSRCCWHHHRIILCFNLSTHLHSGSWSCWVLMSVRRFDFLCGVFLQVQKKKEEQMLEQKLNRNLNQKQRRRHVHAAARKLTKRRRVKRRVHGAESRQPPARTPSSLQTRWSGDC